MFRFFNILPAPLQMCVRSICIHPVPDVTEDEKRAKIQSSNIERDLFEQAKLEVNVIKILLLGATESGKSTMVKQMKIIHSHGFSKPELICFKAAVLDNLLTSMKFVLRGMGLLRINLANKKNRAHARSVLSCGQCFGEDGELLQSVALSFCALWADQGVKAAAARGYEFQLNDSALYFFENISRIISPRYIPTETDVLRVRVRTSGIIETQFPVNNMVFRMYDVGGQRTKRRKWLSYFDCVRAVLFVVALSDYDMTLTEDRSMNRLQESLELFTSICTNIVFRSTSLILLMNKSDLFQEKILNSGRHLRLYFPVYKGADWDVDAASRHITAMFVACNRTPNNRVFHHYTTATDTHNVRVVFHVVMDTIVKENLEAVSLL